MLAVGCLNLPHAQDGRKGIIRVWQGRQRRGLPAPDTGVSAAATVVAAMPWHMIEDLRRCKKKNRLKTT